jgi:hypothetical protein
MPDRFTRCYDHGSLIIEILSLAVNSIRLKDIYTDAPVDYNSVVIHGEQLA